jgi:hypothetical protein
MAGNEGKEGAYRMRSAILNNLTPTHDRMIECEDNLSHHCPLREDALRIEASSSYYCPIFFQKARLIRIQTQTSIYSTLRKPND